MKIVKLAAAPAFILLAGCVTYPYQTAFDSCDAEAGACYRYCEDIVDSDYQLGACHNECDNDANQCFASAYDSYSYGGSAYGGSYYQPSWPWRGRYGAWGPTNGYYFDFSYYGGSHGYDRPRRGRGHGGGRGGHGGGSHGSGGHGSGGHGGGNQGSGTPPNDGGGQRPPRGPRGGEDVDQTGDYPTPNRKDRTAPPLRRREAPPQNTTPPPSRRAAPAPSSTPPPTQQAAPQPAPQTAPPPTQPAPAQRPGKPKSERGSPRTSQPEDY
ncbi:hypothetical protein [Hyphococcus sp.]|uniref:hypothetical protein n=1 Tax=Hyphococcus sp. TaxID=2038636 RepID=UPI0037529D2A